MNKKDCLQKIRSRKLLSVVETTDNHEITLVIKLGDKVMKQSQLEILLAKIDEVKTEFTIRFDKIESDVSEIKNVLKKHDDLFVDHEWLDKSSFK